MAELISKWFIPITEQEKDKDQQKSFQIRPLTSVELWEVNTHMKLIDAEHIGLSFEGQKAALNYGLLAWKNVEDDKGSPAKCHLLNWPKVDSWSLNAVSREIIEMSELTEAERKN